MQVLAGKHMVPQGSVRVLGQPPFHATALTSSGVLSYIGGTWERDIAFAGYAIPLQVRHAHRSLTKCLPTPAQKWPPCCSLTCVHGCADAFQIGLAVAPCGLRPAV